MKIYGHRGASGYAPENTMEAFKLALDMNVDGIETDIHLSSDGVLVLIHDEKVNRTTNGKGYVKDLTYKQLLELDASNQMDGFVGCKIPTLSELLELVQDTNCILHLEIKTDRIRYKGIEQKVYDMVKLYGLQDSVIYSSFNHESMQCIKNIDQSCLVSYTYDGMLYQPWRYVTDHIYGLHPRFSSINNKQFVDECHKHNIVVNTWTVNTIEQINQMKDFGVDGIFTNYPDLIK